MLSMLVRTNPRRYARRTATRLPSSALSVLGAAISNPARFRRVEEFVTISSNFIASFCDHVVAIRSGVELRINAKVSADVRMAINEVLYVHSLRRDLRRANHAGIESQYADAPIGRPVAIVDNERPVVQVCPDTPRCSQHADLAIGAASVIVVRD